MRTTLNDLRKRAHELNGAEIRSLEGQRYIIVIRLDGTKAILSDNHGRTLLFSSLSGANETLSHWRIGNRELVHASPYNEMIGLDEAGIDPLRVPTGRGN